MKTPDIVDYLSQNAGASIRYRVLREIIGVSRNDHEMRKLQQTIAQNPAVRDVLAWPREEMKGEGWIGNELHGAKGFDSGINLIVERGLEGSHPVLSGAKKALMRSINNSERITSTDAVLNEIDAHGRGGHQTIVAWLLAMLGEEKSAFVVTEIHSALDHFEGMRDIETIDSVSIPHPLRREREAGKRVYKRDVRFPGGWHLPLLACSDTWQNEENVSMLCEAFENALSLCPIPIIVMKKRNHYVGPGNIPWKILMPEKLSILSGNAFFVWLRYAEYIAKIGIVKRVAHFRKQFEQLVELIEDDLWMRDFAPVKQFKIRWGLEEDWRSKKRRLNDIYFRYLITLHYAGIID